MKTKNCNLFEEKLCVSLINPQPLDHFFDQKGVKDGKGSRCKACIKAIAHERRLKIGGGKLRIPKRPKAIPVEMKACCNFKKGKCANSMNPQPIKNFRPQEGRINGRSLCLSCETKYRLDNTEKIRNRVREWNKNNKALVRFRRLEKTYGITKEKYIEMHINQKGRCAICSRHESELSRPLVVDHCHETNAVRGLLCDKCNQAIGFFKHDIDYINNAITFLKKYKREKDGNFYLIEGGKEGA